MSRAPDAAGYPSTNVVDLCRLGARMAGTALRHPRSLDTSRVLHDWLRDLTVRYRSANVVLDLVALRLLLVTDRDTSRRILAEPPATRGYAAGTLKRKAMSYLAPHALTIADDELWQQLRPFNERVLCAGRPHDYQAIFLRQVRRAFSAPVTGAEAIRQSMGRAMLGIVFGEGVAEESMATDIRVLFDLVQHPVRRLLRGGRERRRVERLYEGLRRAWREHLASERPSLVRMAREAADQTATEDGPDTLLQQIPHWMFTFSGSGADLLLRGLAMIGSRPAALARAREEIAAAGPLDDPASVERLRFVEACLLESARLFPPVPRTFHRVPTGTVVNGTRLPAGTEIIQIFSLTHRDTATDPTADEFRPERWTAPEAAAAATTLYPNLFLSGARRCPGRDLILFVCKSAAAMLLHESQLRLHSDALAADPLPFSFAEKSLRTSLRTS